MHRDDNLLRQLMLDLEQASTCVTKSHIVKGFTQEQVGYHLALILKSGFAEGIGPAYLSDGSDPTIPSAVIIKRLTPDGHDFISNLRDDAVWATVKERAKAVGGSVSLEVLKQLSVVVVKQILNIQ